MEDAYLLLEPKLVLTGRVAAPGALACEPQYNGSFTMSAILPKQAEPPLVLALDVGTSSVRGLLYDRLGRALKGLSEREEYRVRTSAKGAAELDGDELMESICSVVDALLERGAGAVANHGVAAVALCTFWHSMVGIGAEGRAITPLYTWADARSSESAERLKQRLDAQAIHSRTGAVPHPSYFPARLAWLEETQPELSRRVVRWLSPGEYFHWRLFGRSLCSVSMASGTGLFSQNERHWDEELLEALPIRVEQLSPLVELDTRLEGLCPPYDRRWPALARAPWFPALGDGACNNIGSGCTTPDRVALMVGTSGAMRVVWETARVEIPAGLWCYRVDGRRFVLGGALTGGGDVFAWLRDLLAFDGVINEDLERFLAELSPDDHNLTFLPFPAGERSPGWAGHARAAITGLTFHTRPVDILRAGLEAVAYRFALVAEQMQQHLPPAREIVASGSALRASPAWTQIMADVLARPVTISDEPEASSRGAALLALESLGLLASLEAAPAAQGRVFGPDPQRSARYAEGLERQNRLYTLLIEERIGTL